MRARSGMSFRDVTIAQMGNGARECEWRHAPEARGGIWEFWRNLVKLKTRHQTRRVDFQGLQRPDEFAHYGRRSRCEGRWKSQNRKNVYLSPYVEEPLNSKVIKSHKCFSCFEIFMYSVYLLRTFHVRFSIFMYGYVTVGESQRQLSYIHTGADSMDLLRSLSVFLFFGLKSPRLYDMPGACINSCVYISSNLLLTHSM